MYELLFDDENASGFDAGRRTQKYIDTKEVTKITSIVIRLFSPPPPRLSTSFSYTFLLDFCMFFRLFFAGFMGSAIASPPLNYLGSLRSQVLRLGASKKPHSK